MESEKMEAANNEVVFHMQPMLNSSHTLRPTVNCWSSFIGQDVGIYIGTVL